MRPSPFRLLADLLRGGALVCGLLLAPFAGAATASYSVALDTDSNAATGCTIATIDGPLAGIEQVITTVVNTTAAGATVTRLERSTCSGAAMSPPTTYDAGGWNVGLGNGTAGTGVIETSVPLSWLPPGATMRATAFSTGGGGQDVTSTFAVALDVPTAGPSSIEPVPLSPWLVPPLALGMLLLALWLRRRYPQGTGAMVLVVAFAISGLVWAASVIRDGQIGDWAGVAAAATDPRGDAPADGDIVAVFFQQDGANLYFRFDADVRTVTANQAPMVSAGPALTVTLPAQALLQGSATDDGLPNPPGALTLVWTKIAGPGTVVFGNMSAAVSTASFSTAGAYVLRLTANDGALSASADVTVTVSDAPPAGMPAIAPIADRTIVAGTRLQVVIQATSPTSDALAYALPTAPSGAALRPAPLIDWVPTLAQVGTHAITAQVTDTGGHAASTSFNVTVTAPVNTPPVLGSQVNQSLATGAPFTRTLSGVDPDAGDTLTYSLVAGPTGMTLSGATLQWPTSGRTPGDYTVTVRVTDSKGAYDQKTFTITLQASAPPLAKDDAYTVKPGGTLTIEAPGVLGNDSDPMGGTPSATKLTEPTKGTLSSFDADGSFTYVAPGSVTPSASLKASPLWSAVVYDDTGYAHAADLNHDGGADIVALTFGTPVAFDGKTGAKLWQGWDTSATSLGQNCGMYLFGTDFALGDVDGSGNVLYIAGTQCDAKYSAGVSSRLIGVDTDPAHAVGGAAAVKWVSDRLDVQVPLPPSPGAPPVPTYLVNPAETGLANFASPTLAKLTPTGRTKVLTRILVATNQFPYDSDGDGSRESFASCYAVTGNAADKNKGCTATFVLDAATGVKDLVLTAPNPYNQYEAAEREPLRQLAPVVADLDGDGQVEIVSGTDVFKYDGANWTLAWQAGLPGVLNFYEPHAVSVADIDGDGKAEVVLQAMWQEADGHHRGILTYRHDGVLLHKFDLATWGMGLASIADIDGDGISEILFVARGLVYAYKPDGTLVWAAAVPDDDAALFPDDDPAVKHWPGTPDTRSGPGNGLQIYDLDLDGRPEVIVGGTHRLSIYDGRTGQLKSSMHNNGLSANRMVPLVVDANGDGHADILSAAGNPGICAGCPPTNILAFSGVDRNWAPAPLAHNQISFNPWSVTGSGAIVYDGAVHRSFRTQKQLGTPVDPRTRDSATFTYAATGSGGTSAPATVTLLVVPPNSPPVITSTPPSSLHVVLQGGQYPTFLYQIAATDPDVGDTVRYELVHSSVNTGYFPQATVDPVTGTMRMFTGPCGSYGGPCDFGPMVFIVAAVDSHGARTEQGFVVDVTSQSRTVPAVVGQVVDAAKGSVTGVQLVPRVNEVFSAQPVGRVVAQDPAGGTVVARSSTVTLSVSKGLQPVAMPFLVGQPLARAQAALANLGLQGQVTAVSSTSVPAGEVMTQSPASGTLLHPGIDPPVALGVSTGGPLRAPVASILLAPGPGPLSRLVGDDIAFKATAVLTDGTSADVTVAAVWSSSATGVATVDVAGTAHAKASGTTTIAAAFDGKTGQVVLNAVAVNPGDNLPPVAAITSPADGATLTGAVDVIGTASDPNLLRYELAYALAGDTAYAVIGDGTSSVTNGVLGRFDPTLLPNDLYTLRLTVIDRGQNETIVESTVQSSGQRKVGMFSLAFTDLGIAMAGLPIDVVRSYDSRDKSVGDFGVGWRLGLQTLRLRTNRVLGTGWVRTVSGAGSSLTPTAWHTASITLPDGRVEQFDMRLSPTSGIGLLTSTRVTGFAPRSGAQGTLEVLGNTDLLVVDAASEHVLVDDSTFEVYEPRRFRYTSRQGTRYEIDRIAGVTSVEDRHGNKLTLGPTGIEHSSGQRVQFTRDAKGRITSIIDPKGNVQSYAYDGNGDLARHVDATGGISSYLYDRQHGLIEWRNPLGTRAVRNDYDDAGRLLSMTDAAGRTVTFDHDTTAGVETVTDRRGNVTRLHYDAEGNVTRQERPVTIDGALVTAVTTSAFDALGNETSRNDADGRATSATFDGLLPSGRRVDPSGTNLLTTIGYTPRGLPSSITDPAGGTYAFGYDANGALTSASMPGGSTVTFMNDAAGQMVSRVDPLGHRTAITRDASGRPVREERYDDAAQLLRRLDFTWDASGNLASKTLHRTTEGVTSPLTTTYAYDAANRLVAETDAAGGVRRTEYDAAGRMTATVDPLGRRTTYAYDDLDQRTRTTYPDGTFETTTYDVDGNITATTDRAGRATTHAYDEMRRRVRTTLPGGATSEYVFSPAGRLVATIDARGHRTDYAYDTAGRRTATTHPAVADGPGGPVVRPAQQSTFDTLSRVTAVTDPKGRVTSYELDARGQRTKTTHPDGGVTLDAWDALGRRTHTTDPDGKVTTYAYDGLGRLVAVTGLGGTATYAYDEAGNRIAQTDALGRVTRMRYDALDRLVERRYPAGDTERFVYDAAGQLVASTSPANKTTTFVLDAMGNVTRKILPDGTAIDTAYAADGQRTAVVDARGTTTYAYDSAGRLASAVQPDGATLSYAHDPNGNLVSLAAPAGTVTYAWDALDRLAQTSGPEGTTTYARDLVGNVVRRTDPNGLVTDTTIDARDRATSIVQRVGVTTLQSFAIGYSPAGRRTGITELDGSVTTYAYDAVGRLAAETRTGTQPYATTHAWDAAGNRTQTVRNGATTAFTYDVNDRLLQAGTTSYAWDANGNLASRTTGGAVTQFGFDAQDRLASVQEGGTTWQYAYDADGNRVRATDTTGSTHFLVDTMNPTGYAQVIEERDGGGGLLARQTFDTALASTTRAGAARHVLADPFGSVRALSDSAGSITDRYLDDAWGTPVSASGATSNPYRYRSERVDGTGLYDLRARAYDPAAGRFVSRDPFAGEATSPVSLHRYLYGSADPVNHVDPSGMMSLPEVSIVTQLMAGLAVAHAGATFLGGIYQEQGFTLAAMNAGQQLVGELFLIGASELIIARVAGPILSNWALPKFAQLFGRATGALGLTTSAAAAAEAMAALRAVVPIYARVEAVLAKQAAGKIISGTAEADIRIATSSIRSIMRRLSFEARNAVRQAVESWQGAALGSELGAAAIEETVRITESGAWNAFCKIILSTL